MSIKYDNIQTDNPGEKQEVANPENTLIDYEDEEEVEDEDIDNEEADEDEDEDLDGEEEEEAAEPPKKVNSKQSPETDSAFAKMRRELESTKRALSERENFAKESGFNSFDEMRAYYDQRKSQEAEENRQKREEELRDAGYDPDIIREIMRLDPQYNEVLRQNEALKQNAKDQKLMSEFNELKAEYPELVKEPEDIPPETWDKYNKGYSLMDAYVAVNRKEIEKRNKEVTKQKTLNNLNGKQHLKTEGDGSGQDTGDLFIDEQTLAYYQELGMSKKEAIKFHKKIYG